MIEYLVFFCYNGSVGIVVSIKLNVKGLSKGIYFEPNVHLAQLSSASLMPCELRSKEWFIYETNY